MPITLNKPALRDLHTELVNGGAATSVPTQLLDRLVAILGDRKALGMTVESSGSIAQKLERGNLSLEQKLALAKKGLDSQEKADVQSLLSDAAFVGLLDAATTNFLKALLDIEPLIDLRVDLDVVETGVTGRTETSQLTPERVAVREMRELIANGKLRDYYKAATGAVDNPELAAKAMELFNRLPVIDRATTANDFVRMGYWTAAPRGFEEMQRSARYIAGRQVLVETTVNVSGVREALSGYSNRSNNDVLSYDPDGVRAITYRATLVGEDPENASNFLVAVDLPGGDSKKTISVSKKGIFDLNQPHELDDRFIDGPSKQKMPYNWETWTMDYNSPWAKAKLAEIAIKMDEHVQKLDFTQAAAEGSGNIISVISRSRTEDMVRVQESCAKAVFDSIDMYYPKGGTTAPGRCNDREEDIGRQAVCGTGMCVQQTTVFGGLLMPFAKSLGMDMQFKVGNVYRFIKADSTNPFRDDAHGGHGWWQVTYRPSMTVVICDRTWNQVNHPLDKAYGFPNGDRYPRNDAQGYSPIKTKPTDVNTEISVETFERQFAREGDGREGHIANTQPRG